MNRRPGVDDAMNRRPRVDDAATCRPARARRTTNGRRPPRTARARQTPTTTWGTGGCTTAAPTAPPTAMAAPSPPAEGGAGAVSSGRSGSGRSARTTCTCTTTRACTTRRGPGGAGRGTRHKPPPLKYKSPPCADGAELMRNVRTAPVVMVGRRKCCICVHPRCYWHRRTQECTRVWDIAEVYDPMYQTSHLELKGDVAQLL
eukprot:1184212-Prorocentrum_minimum.AAC.4